VAQITFSKKSGNTGLLFKTNKMNYRDSIYYKVGRATDLDGLDRMLYRILEILPGFLTWITIISIFIIPIFFPFTGAVLIILFDVYWLLKTIYFSIYLYQNWKKTKHNLNLDWSERLVNFKYNHIYHLILLPFYNETLEVVEKSLESLVSSKYDKNKMIVILASEMKAGKEAKEITEKAKNIFSNKFGHFLITTHPSGVLGEMPGKGSNISYAIEQARIEILDKENINYDDVLVSAFDIDTVSYSQYFNCLTWNFLTTEDPYHSSYQPIPFYNNNLWDAPLFSRVSSSSNTLLQMMQQERPDKLETFSSHSMTFKALYEIGYWQKNMVSEDSRIFWNAFLAYNGNYKVVPMSYPVSMDGNLAPSFWKTIKNIYKQQRRWSWGVENIPYVLFGFMKNKKISRFKKVFFSWLLIDSFWTRSNSSMIILLLGWCLIWFGGRIFNSTIMSYNLPIITGNLLAFTMFGLILSAIISFSFLPPHPQKFDLKQKVLFLLQWLLIPAIVIIFGSIPSIDAQTRLMFGKYMGFWVTPKHRKNNISVL
jgi:cellulose synthase/poly-beta-1,6-N-acetylglucosamine synthase-like glycosyltransferase